MRTAKEIEKKYDELNELLGDQINSMNLVTEVQKLMEEDNPKNKEKVQAMGIKLMSVSAQNISLDAQRYILEWIMGQHD